MIKRFVVTVRYGNRPQRIVSAQSHGNAARAVAATICGRGIAIQRVTGEPRKAGLFQAYKSGRGGGQTSCGPNIHVREALRSE